MTTERKLKIENLDRLIEAIEKESVAHFAMQTWVQPVWWRDGKFFRTDPGNVSLAPCNTVACIGGHCEILLLMDEMGKVPTQRERKESLLRKQSEGGYAPFRDVKIEMVQEFLGLNEEKARRLCYPFGLGYRTKEEALVVLRELRAAGNFHWGHHGEKYAPDDGDYCDDPCE